MKDEISLNTLVRNNPALMLEPNLYAHVYGVEKAEKIVARSVVSTNDGIDYNVVYRNMPGWFYKDEKLEEKVRMAEEEKKPLIPDVSDVEKCNPVHEERECQKEKFKTLKGGIIDAPAAFYDAEGSRIRNEVRESFIYGKNGKRVAL